MSTPNLGLTLPTVGADNDVWGTEINTALTAIDTVFSTGGQAVSFSKVSCGVSLTAAFGTSGQRLVGNAFTQTDSTTGAGTVATAYANLTGAWTLATASNAITVTNAYGHYFVAPVAGSHVTLTNGWALGADSANIAGNLSIAGGFYAQNYLSGLTLSTAGSSATFSVATGAAADSTNVQLMTLASSISKTTGSWAVGTGNGALDAGSIAISTTYHVYLIRRPDTGVVDVLISTSASSPTMPTNYTQKRRIGAIKTDGSSNWTAFSQNGDEFLWLAPVKDAAGASFGATTAISVALSVPNGIVVNALMDMRFDTGSVGPAILVTSLDQTDTAASSSAYTVNLSAPTPTAFTRRSVRTNTSRQIRLRADQTDATYTIFTTGWIDTRGK